MATIPHGSAVLAQGSATPFAGRQPRKTPTDEYAFSRFPSFNSTAFPTQPFAAPVINAAGSSDKLTTPAPGFPEYDLTVPASAANPRTPFETNPPDPPLPEAIDGVAMQEVVNDPIKLLQAVISQQVDDGQTFEGVALNIATQAEISFFQNPNSQLGAPTVSVNPINGAGGIENIIFLQGGESTGPKGPNAETALVYATFWIEKASHPDRRPFMQLQYAQMAVLNFEVLLGPLEKINTGWPHISVATLRKDFS